MQGKDRREVLARGLSRLDPEFAAKICIFCDGVGEYEQRYTLGCGMGYAKMMGPCDHCKQSGLLYGWHPVPASVISQVLEAGSRP